MKVIWESPSRCTRNDVQGYAAMPEGLRRPLRSTASAVYIPARVSVCERLRRSVARSGLRHYLRSMRRAVRRLRSVRRRRQEQSLSLSGFASVARCVARDARIRLDATRRHACARILFGSVAIVSRVRSCDRRRDQRHSRIGGAQQAIATLSDG